MTSALPSLYKEAANADERVRSLAVRKIGELAGPGDLPGVMELLSKARNPGDLEASEQALSMVCLKAANADPVVQRIKDAMSGAQTPQRVAFLRVLTAIGAPSALNLVRLCVADSEREVRAAAIRSLGDWNGPDAAPALLDIARTSEDSTERLIALRGYLRFAGSTDLPQDRRLAMCRDAAGIVQKPEEKKLLLSALSGIPSVDSVSLIERSLEDEAIQLEAANAVVSVSEKLLGGNAAAASAPKLMAPLEKASKIQNEDLARRARDLLEKARDKAR